MPCHILFACRCLPFKFPLADSWKAHSRKQSDVTVFLALRERAENPSTRLSAFLWQQIFYPLASQSADEHMARSCLCVCICFKRVTLYPFTSFCLTLNRLTSTQPMQMRPGGALPHILSAPVSYGQVRGCSSHQNGNLPISKATHTRGKEGRAAHRWQGHQFHETFPPLHLKARRNHVQGWCTMKWNGRPDLGERTQRCVQRNEGHSLRGDACVSRKGPAGSEQAVTQAASRSHSVPIIHIFS